jgi:hypothetical protein
MEISIDKEMRRPGHKWDRLYGGKTLMTNQTQQRRARFVLCQHFISGFTTGILEWNEQLQNDQ